MGFSLGNMGTHTSEALPLILYTQINKKQVYSLSICSSYLMHPRDREWQKLAWQQVPLMNLSKGSLWWVHSFGLEGKICSLTNIPPLLSQSSPICHSIHLSDTIQPFHFSFISFLSSVPTTSLWYCLELPQLCAIYQQAALNSLLQHWLKHTVSLNGQPPLKQCQRIQSKQYSKTRGTALQFKEFVHLEGLRAKLLSPIIGYPQQPFLANDTWAHHQWSICYNLSICSFRRMWGAPL